jgi:hypothetical protein
MAVVTGDPVVTATRIDQTTQGNWVGTYGSCYSVLPQASPRHCFPEVIIGPDFESTNPEQYTNVVPIAENCGPIEFQSAICISGDAPNNFDVRFFTRGEEEAYAWGFDDYDCVPTATDPCAFKVAEHAAQYNVCLSTAEKDVYYPSTFDSDDTAENSPMSGEIRINKGGSATIAYYFLTEADGCRGQSYELFVNDVSVASGKVTDFRTPKYVVFDIENIPDNALVRLDTTKLPSDDPEQCNPDVAPNSHLSGIFVDGTDACAPPVEAPSRTLGYWKNHPTVINGVFGGAPSLLPLTFCGETIEQNQVCEAVYFLSQGGGGKRKFMRQGMAALLNCTAFGCPTEISDLIAEASEACGNGDSYKYGKAGGILGTFNEANDDLPLPFQSPSALPKYCR